MSRASKLGFLLLFAIGLLAARPAAASGGTAGPLASVDWLRGNLGRADVVVIDASPPPMYAAQHIPGAVSASLLNYGAREVAPAVMEERFQSWGIGPGKKVVLYDQGEPMWATKLFFDLYYHGFPAQDLYVLDGGLAKWMASGAPVTKEPTPAPPKGTFRITTMREDVRARPPEFLAATGDPGRNALLEALSPDWHFGKTAFFDRAGHIPNGIMLPSADFYRADKTFKSPGEIAAMLKYLGVGPEQQIYTYCGGGIAASVPFFALKFVLGYPKVKLYEESELGWLRDDRGLPYWTYDAPYLARQTGWLKTWGGKMMRMYGMSQVSIVDVRPAEEFKFGHVPFALNVPAEAFRRNLATPAKLAEILGAAGVDAAHEAVVVSGAGLDRDSALAFLMLERLGQARVSVFMDSFAKSAQIGLALAGDAADPKKAPPPAPARPYAAKSRDDVVITDAAGAPGPYPRIFIASGKTVPVKAPEGKIVHVPYTDLLNADGTPKAAKDIWSLLAKAGIPRYAELVTYSDDPGEAAANYYVLKLMGFPDVKVLAM